MASFSTPGINVGLTWVTASFPTPGLAILVLFLLLHSVLAKQDQAPLPCGHRRSGGSGHRRPPHIILIVADDLGYNDVSWHNPAMLTPHLAELAATGVTLEQHYAQPKCAPSRAALLTGRYPFHIGRQHESLSPMMPTGVSLKFPLLPESLAALGYKTHAVGKWHLGYCDWAYTPTRRGFDSFFGFYSHGEDYYSRTASDNGDVFSGYDLRANETVTREGLGEYSAELFSRKAAEVIETHNPERPLFLYLAFQNIHKPIQVPDAYARLYQPTGKLTKESQRRGMITALDDAVANVTAALRRSGLYRDSLIVFLSDNGGAERGSNWPLRGKKNSVYEGGTRTVAFVHGPRLVRAHQRGTVSRGLVHLVDWYPTLVALAGGSCANSDEHSAVAVLNDLGNSTEKRQGDVRTDARPLDGMDQTEHLLAGGQPPRTELIYNINDALRVTAAIRSGRWKLIWGYAEGLTSEVMTREEKAEAKDSYHQSFFRAARDGLLQLYDLEADPGEEDDLAETYRNTVTRDLMRKIRKILQSGEIEKPDIPLPRMRAHPRFYGDVVSPGWCTAH